MYCLVILVLILRSDICCRCCHRCMGWCIRSNQCIRCNQCIQWSMGIQHKCCRQIESQLQHHACQDGGFQHRCCRLRCILHCRLRCIQCRLGKQHCCRPLAWHIRCIRWRRLRCCKLRCCTSIESQLRLHACQDGGHQRRCCRLAYHKWHGCRWLGQHMKRQIGLEQ